MLLNIITVHCQRLFFIIFFFLAWPTEDEQGVVLNGQRPAWWNGCDGDGAVLGAGCVIASAVRHSCATSVLAWFLQLRFEPGTSGCFWVNTLSGNVLLLLPIEDLCFHRREVSVSRSLCRSLSPFANEWNQLLAAGSFKLMSKQFQTVGLKR